MSVHKWFFLRFGQTIFFKGKGQEFLDMGQVTAPVGGRRFFINGLIIGQRQQDRIDARRMFKLFTAYIAKKAIASAPT